MIFTFAGTVTMPPRLAWRLPKFSLGAFPSAAGEDLVILLAGHLMGTLGETLARSLLESARTLGTLDAQLVSLMEQFAAIPPVDIEQRLRGAS